MLNRKTVGYYKAIHCFDTTTISVITEVGDEHSFYIRVGSVNITHPQYTVNDVNQTSVDICSQLARYPNHAIYASISASVLQVH